MLGYRRAIIFGGVVMAIGEFMILGGTEFWLFLGMSAIIIGNGYFKANISTLLGKLYKEGDPLRDSGFTIFYMGINIGALLATVAVAPIGETYGFKWGFGMAGVGMLVGVAIFLLGQDKLEGAGEPQDMDVYRKWSKLVYIVSLAAIPALYALINYGQDVVILGQDMLFYILMGLLIYVCFNLLRAGFKGDAIQRDRIIVMMILMTFNVVFWACFEQAGSSLTLFADRNVDRNIFDIYTMPASQTQFFNPAFIIIFGSVFSVMWVRLARIGKNPNIPMKFGMGIIQLGLGYLMLLVGNAIAGPEAMVPLLILGMMYLLHTTGELFLSPIGLSMVTKLAPKNMTGAAMGAWFLSLRLLHVRGRGPGQAHRCRGRIGRSGGQHSAGREPAELCECLRQDGLGHRGHRAGAGHAVQAAEQDDARGRVGRTSKISGPEFPDGVFCFGPRLNGG